jgi:hypothetical protein
MRRSIVYFAAVAAVFATAHLASAQTVVAAGASDQASAPVAVQASPASTRQTAPERTTPTNVAPREASVGFGWG